MVPVKWRGWSFNFRMDDLRVQWRCFLWPFSRLGNSLWLTVLHPFSRLYLLFYHQLGGLSPLRQLEDVLSCTALFTQRERAVLFHLYLNDTSHSLCCHVLLCQLRCHPSWKESVSIQAVSCFSPLGNKSSFSVWWQSQLLMAGYLKMQRSSCHLAHSLCSGCRRRSCTKHRASCQWLSLSVTWARVSHLQCHLPLAHPRLVLRCVVTTASPDPHTGWFPFQGSMIRPYWVSDSPLDTSGWMSRPHLPWMPQFSSNLQSNELIWCCLLPFRTLLVLPIVQKSLVIW